MHCVCTKQAACFAFGYATLAELQYKYVGQDQLIGGTWPVRK